MKKQTVFGEDTQESLKQDILKCVDENGNPKNPFRKNTDAWKFWEMAEVKNNGESKKLLYEELEKVGLLVPKGTNGIGWKRNVQHYYAVSPTKNKKQHNKIVGIQLLGYQSNIFSENISNHIKKYHKQFPCPVLGISDVEIDHKNGRKDDFNKKLGLKDYQPLNASPNNAKRQHCINCKKTHTRFDARILGFTVGWLIGTKKYEGSCNGCYWYDVIKFHREIAKFCYINDIDVEKVNKENEIKQEEKFQNDGNQLRLFR